MGNKIEIILFTFPCLVDFWHTLFHSYKNNISLFNNRCDTIMLYLSHDKLDTKDFIIFSTFFDVNNIEKFIFARFVVIINTVVLYLIALLNVYYLASCVFLVYLSSLLNCFVFQISLSLLD